MNGSIVLLRDDPGHEGQRLKRSGYTLHTNRGSSTAAPSSCNSYSDGLFAHFFFVNNSISSLEKKKIPRKIPAFHVSI